MTGAPLTEAELELEVRYTLALSTGLESGFPTIVVDPPWKFPRDNFAQGGTWGANGGLNVSSEERYGALETAAIARLPVGDFAAENAYLWLWITARHFMHAEHLRLFAAWGFVARGWLPWIKTDPRPGVGNWMRYKFEAVVLATRGKVDFLGPLGMEALLEAPRPGGHSEKPPEFFELVEEFCPGPRLELFGRKPRPDQLDVFGEAARREPWIVWGNEVGDPLDIGFDPAAWIAVR